MKRLWALMICLLVVALAPTAGIGKEPIKIGVIRDLTSAHADAGRAELDAIKMVFDEVCS